MERTKKLAVNSAMSYFSYCVVGFSVWFVVKTIAKEVMRLKNSIDNALDFGSMNIFNQE